MPNDVRFRASILFTTRFTVLVTGVGLLLSFGMALLVQRAFRGVGLFRTAFFLPVVIGMAPASLLWVWLLNDQVGVVTRLLQLAQLTNEPVRLLSSPNLALVSISAMTVWKSVGFGMLIFLVGLQAIPRELYEAARVDGAGPIACLRSITLPLLRRSFALVLVLTVTTSYLAFEQFFIMTRGGPDNSTISLVYRLYSTAFVSYKLGYAAALAAVLLVALVLLNAAQLRLLRQEAET